MKFSARLCALALALCLVSPPVSAQTLINGQAATIFKTVERSELCVTGEALIVDTSRPYGVRCDAAGGGGSGTFAGTMDQITVTESPADTFTFSLPDPLILPGTIQGTGLGIGTAGVAGQFNFGEATAGGPVLSITEAADDVDISMVPSGVLRLTGTESIALYAPTSLEFTITDGVTTRSLVSYGAESNSILTNSSDGLTVLSQISTAWLSGERGLVGIYGTGMGFQNLVELGQQGGPFWNFYANGITEFPGDISVTGSVSASGYTAGAEVGFTGTACTEFTGGLCTDGTP